MSSDLDRVSLTLPTEMTDRLDGIVEDWDYDSRSEAVRDAIREFFVTHDWETGDRERYHGTVVVVHEHDHDSGLAGDLQAIQHEMADIVTSVQHIHLDSDRCMETIVVAGAGGRIEELANRLRSMEGVKQVKAVVVGGDADDGHGHEHGIEREESQHADHGH
jgi:CopG family nickel-responsive transcriptional regulator